MAGNSEASFICKPFSKELEKNIFLAVREWIGQPIVELRVFENGHPTKKGLEFPPARWNTLMFVVDSVNKALQRIMLGEADVKYEAHLGGNVFVQVTAPYRIVDIRQRFRKQGTLYHTREGLKLHASGWQCMLDQRPLIHESIPNLDAYRPCFLNDDHQNQMGAMECKECSPDGTGNSK